MSIIFYVKLPTKTKFNSYSLYRWTLESLGCYNPYSGITTNFGEGYNHLIKLMTEKKELPSDVVALTLYYLTAYHWNEIVRGFCGKVN